MVGSSSLGFIVAVRMVNFVLSVDGDVKSENHKGLVGSMIVSSQGDEGVTVIDAQREHPIR